MSKSNINIRILCAVLVLGLISCYFSAFRALTAATSTFGFYFGSPHLVFIAPSNMTAAAPSNMTAAVTSTNSTSNMTRYLTYQNPIYGVKIQYPSDWNKDLNLEHFTHDPTRGWQTQFAGFHPPLPGRIVGPSSIQCYVSLVSYNTSSTSMNDLMGTRINSYESSYPPDFRVVNSSANVTLAGSPAYIFTFEFTATDGVPQKGIEIGTFHGFSNSYYIQAVVDADQYAHYVPTLLKMIHSFDWISTGL